MFVSFQYNVFSSATLEWGLAYLIQLPIIFYKRPTTMNDWIYSTNIEEINLMDKKHKNNVLY